MKQNRWRWKNVTARHLTTREGHWNSGAGVRLVDRAAHFKQEVTRGGQTGSVRQSGDVVPLCFLSRPFPFPRSPWRHARPREEGERKGSEKVRERRAFWGIPPPPTSTPPPSPPSTFQNADSNLWALLPYEHRSVVTRRSVWIQILLTVMLPAADRCSGFYSWRCEKRCFFKKKNVTFELVCYWTSFTGWTETCLQRDNVAACLLEV